MPYDSLHTSGMPRALSKKVNNSASTTIIDSEWIRKTYLNLSTETKARIESRLDKNILSTMDDDELFDKLMW